MLGTAGTTSATWASNLASKTIAARPARKIRIFTTLIPSDLAPVSLERTAVNASPAVDRRSVATTKATIQNATSAK